MASDRCWKVVHDLYIAKLRVDSENFVPKGTTNYELRSRTLPSQSEFFSLVK